MWIQRSPEEVAKWKLNTERQARADGLMIGVLGWAGAAVLLSAGWVVSFQSGVAVQGSFGGTFWTRLPIFVVLASPVVFIARRYESKKSLRKAASRTICPQCDTPGDGNAGASCKCGGSFVPSSTMKWVEK